ncbi:MAG: TadE family protein [Candidatus Dormiibacterota bacterium]
MVELAILLPVLIVLFLGSWTAAAWIGDNDTAIQATRSGARYAAELGDTTPASVTSPCTNDTCQVDLEIIQEMLPIVSSNMPNAVVSEIDVYQPGDGNCGTFTPGSCPSTSNGGAYVAGDLIDEYRVSGSSITVLNTPQYLLSLRDQVHPDESELGVRVVFTYTSPTLSFFTQTDTQFTVVRLAPEE